MPEQHPKTGIPNDTHPEIERRMLDAIRKMSPAQKLQAVSDMGLAMRRMAMAEIKTRYPEADERELMLRAVSRVIPADLMKKAYGWDVEEKGY